MDTLPFTNPSSAADPQGISLWIPPAAGAAAAILVVGISAFVAFRAAGSKGAHLGHWLSSEVKAGPAWSPTDSWATNVAGAGGLLGAVVTATGSNFGSVLTPDAVVAITVLFLIFSGIAALAPVTYGALAIKTPDTSIGNADGSAWGFLTTALVTMTAVMGELATVALLVWQASSSAAGKIILVIILGIGALLATLYTIKTVKLFAANQPAPAEPQKVPAVKPEEVPAPRVLTSLLGNARSATL